MMKKINLLAALLLAFTASTMQAQTDSATVALQNKLDSLQQNVATLQEKEAARTQTEYNNAIWKRKKHISISFSAQNMEDADNPLNMKFKSQAGFTFDWGKTFYLHKKPIANLMKIGLDWSWINLSFAKYKSGSGIDFNSLAGIYSDYDDDDDDYGYGDFISDIDLGVYSLSAGMSVGPSFTFAPFYGLGKGLQHLLVQTYFHVTPSYTGIIMSEDGEDGEDDKTEFYNGYTTYFNWGINVSYKFISVGYEYRWGKSKFNQMSLDFDDDGEDESETTPSNDKQKIKFGSSAFYIRLNF
jgi:hypothetical protein